MSNIDDTRDKFKGVVKSAPVVVDYLQLMSSDEKVESSQKKVADFYRGLFSIKH